MTSGDFFWEKFVKNMIDLMIVKKRGGMSFNLWFKCVGGCCDIEKVLPSVFAGCDKTVDAGKGIF